MPILRAEQLLEGLIASLALREYVVKCAEEENDETHTVFAKSEAQAIRIAVNHLKLEGELWIWRATDWETCLTMQTTTGRKRYYVPPNIYQGKMSHIGGVYENRNNQPKTRTTEGDEVSDDALLSLRAEAEARETINRKEAVAE